MKVRLDSGAKQPTRAFPTDAGLDLYAMHGGLVRAHQAATFHTGTHVELPHGTVGILMPKSGMMTRHDLLTFGIVDEGYTGEVLVHIFNCGGDDYSVQAGDKVSQPVNPTRNQRGDWKGRKGAHVCGLGRTLEASEG